MQVRMAPSKLFLCGLALAGALGAGASPAFADKIKNPTAIFAGLDKVTGRTISFETAIDETVQFGALQLTARVCYSRPPTEAANTTAFVEVDEITFQNDYRRIFTGWMFASSPGLSGIEHAIYDIWLTECKGGSEIIDEPKEPERPPEIVAQPPRQPGAPTQARRPQPAPEVRPASADQRLDVEPQRGVPVRPTQAPTRRFFPTNPSGGGGGGGGAGAPMRIGPDPTGGNR